MDTLIVWLIVAAALVFMIKGVIKIYKGEGGCAGNCRGCVGRKPGGSCDPEKLFFIE